MILLTLLVSCIGKSTTDNGDISGDVTDSAFSYFDTSSEDTDYFPTIDTGSSMLDSDEPDTGNGGPVFDQGRTGERSDITYVASGNVNTCALTVAGEAVCWGTDNWGESSPPPIQFVEVDLGPDYVGCGVSTKQEIACWGLTGYLSKVPSGSGYSSISVESNYACTLDRVGALLCWGDTSGEHEDYGQVSEAPNGESFVQVSAGEGHACALKDDGSVVCWGNNITGPITPPDEQFVQISSGSYHACGLTVEDTVVCWGEDGNGQANPPADFFVQVEAGELHTCGITTDAEIRCWGIARGTNTDETDGAYLQVSAGGLHTCAVKETGVVQCWGNNTYGQSSPP